MGLEGPETEYGRLEAVSFHPPQSLETARGAAPRPTEVRPPTQHTETAIHTTSEPSGAERSDCMLHEVGLSTQHEPQ